MKSSTTLLEVNIVFSRVFGLHPMLALKELHQHQLKFVIYTLLLSGMYIAGPFLVAGLNARAGQPWDIDLVGLVHSTIGSDAGTTGFGFLGWMIAFGLGIFLLSDEKKNGTLEFLLATPVTRRQVVKAKYVTGMTVLVLNVLAVAVYLSGLVQFISTPYTLFDVWVWCARQAAVLAAVFSISFAASTVAGNAVSAGIISAGLIFGPAPVLLGFRNFLYGLGLIRLEYGLGRVLERIAYAADTLGSVVLGGPHAALPSLPACFLLALLCVGLYYLSVWLFDRSPLERNGQILVFGDTARVLQLVVGAAAALWTASAAAGNTGPLGFLLLVGTGFFVPYLLLGAGLKFVKFLFS